ncbi:hypothetical protein PENTCL1PPCAC_7758 [Pristionchus entomophagus]|uniref:Uncharacterized protein n=1 Tax=Pristionchus entomophagus TaxID=358040 RepID=A0AAV5SU14_9BILA|nr:hypothetical protein PENTCL1PPCAC_7758 [Pristionchus entomophagus]
MGHEIEDIVRSQENNRKMEMKAWTGSTVSMDSGVSNLSKSTHSLQSTVSESHYSSSSSVSMSQSTTSFERSASMKRRLEANQSSLDQAISISPELAHSVFIAANAPESPLPALRSHSVLAVQQESYQQASAVQESHHEEVHHTTETLVTSASMESSQTETTEMVIKEQAAVAIAPTPTPRISRVEKIESSALSVHYETEFSKITAPVHQVDLDAATDDVVVIRQFDFAPSPVQWIRLYTSQEDPPAEIALKVTQKVSASCILGKEEEEGSFEEGWEEVVVQHYEEEVRRKRVEHKRAQLLERIEQSKTEYYSYGHRRRYDMVSLGSPYSPRNIESPYPMHSFQTA